MRVLLILISLLLVGCSELESDLENAVSENKPTVGKDLIKLYCEFLYYVAYVVIDRRDELFIYATVNTQAVKSIPTKESDTLLFQALPLAINDQYYAGWLTPYEQDWYKLNRRTLKFGTNYQCQPTDVDLSELRALGKDKVRQKI